MSGGETINGVYHEPHIGTGTGATPFHPRYWSMGFGWRCTCGARGRRRWSGFSGRIHALNAWSQHVARLEKRVTL